jgi:fructokinase
MYHLGIDLGGTKIEGVIIDNQYIEQYRVVTETQQELGYIHILDTTLRLYQEMFEQINGAHHSLGIGTPGSLSSDTGKLRFCNIVEMNGKTIKKDIEAQLNRKITLENDANCFALAEARIGAGKGYSNIFGIVMGTGCGGGYITDGFIMQGRNRIAGEWGHMVYHPDGPSCYCGRSGCIERYLSGNGLENQYLEHTGKPLSVESIVKCAEAGDRSATHIMEGFIHVFGASVASLIAIIDPDIIVLGGGLSNIEKIYTDGIKSVQQHLFSRDIETPIVINALGASSGVLGAALISFEQAQ